MHEEQIVLFGCPIIDNSAVYIGPYETDECSYYLFNAIMPGNREVEISVKIPGSDKKLAATQLVSMEMLLA